MRGVPLRLEIGPKDVAKSQVFSARRDNRTKAPISWGSITEKVPALLEQIQKDLFDKAKEFLDDNTTQVSDYEELKSVMNDRRGFIIAPWCGSADCEDQVKADTTATIRVMPADSSADTKCVVCNKGERVASILPRPTSATFGLGLRGRRSGSSLIQRQRRPARRYRLPGRA